ncbi:MAG: hypothetical protein ISS55_01160 [Dehalococcoidales bacterium]|nr:hypothetical protein [Dehalococcoidales bacterium]
MGIPVAYSVNCGFGWFIVLLAIAGYFLTWRRMRERWSFWIILAVGWAFFATAQTLIAAGVSAGTPYLAAIWLSSFVLVIASLVMLFAKLTGRVKEKE